MANKRSSTKKQSKQQQQMVVYKKPKVASGGDSTAMNRLKNHVNMIIDPCNAVIGPTAYRGSDGFVTRFKNVVAAGTLTNFPYYVSVFYPAYNATTTGVYASASTPVSVSWSSGPGQAFLLANADSQRVVGACTRLNYLGSELNRQGIVYRGVMPAAALTGATVTGLITLCQSSQRVADGVIETKFVPSSVEEQYWSTGGVAPTDDGDRNVIVTIVYGGTSVNCDTFLEHTLICEWRPKFGVGLVSPPPNTPDVPGGLEKVRTVLSRLGHWWLEHKETASSAIKTATGLYNSTKSIAGMAARLAIAL
jgi:hypothetical protein